MEVVNTQPLRPKKNVQFMNEAEIMSPKFSSPPSSQMSSSSNLKITPPEQQQQQQQQQFIKDSNKSKNSSNLRQI
jgi:hypothetical protein